MKAETGQEGTEWEDFKKIKKEMGDTYLTMVIAATPSKSATKAGKKTQPFNFMQHMKEKVYTSRVATGMKKVWKTQVGLTNHLKNELGWSMLRCKQEWEYLLAKAGPTEIRKVRDR
eukprot:2659589-Lingulodinium_polyedra.AAC.1